MARHAFPSLLSLFSIPSIIILFSFPQPNGGNVDVTLERLGEYVDVSRDMALAHSLFLFSLHIIIPSFCLNQFKKFNFSPPSLAPILCRTLSLRARIIRESWP